MYYLINWLIQALAEVFGKDSLHEVGRERVQKLEDVYTHTQKYIYNLDKIIFVCVCGFEIFLTIYYICFDLQEYGARDDKRGCQQGDPLKPDFQ